MSASLHNLPDLREQADRLRAELPAAILDGADTRPWRKKLQEIEGEILRLEHVAADSAARAATIARETLGRISDALAGLEPPPPPTACATT
jgi:hypothetical protein